ncbi:NAD(P)-binding domain [Phytophthora cactorum]|nr:NAD(P)-binding domain [Phytophthora cactorum]
MTTPNGKTIGICGATGAVGIEIISVLAAHKFPVKQLVLFASSRSAGKKVDTAFGEVTISLFSVEKAAKLDYVFLAVSGDFSLQYAKELAAVPNGPVKLIVSTYQAASGAGAAGMEELADGAKAFLADEPVTYKVFSYPLPFNLIRTLTSSRRMATPRGDEGHVGDTQDLWRAQPRRELHGCPHPIMRAHSEALSIETVKPVNIARAREILAKADGVDLVDEPEKLLYPMPKTPLRSSTSKPAGCARAWSSATTAWSCSYLATSSCAVRR